MSLLARLTTGLLDAILVGAGKAIDANMSLSWRRCMHVGVGAGCALGLAIGALEAIRAVGARGTLHPVGAILALRFVKEGLVLEDALLVLATIAVGPFGAQFRDGRAGRTVATQLAWLAHFLVRVRVRARV